jgi:hypothetical protein
LGYPTPTNKWQLKNIFLDPNRAPELRMNIKQVREYNEFMAPYRLAAKESGWNPRHDQ